MNGMAIIEERAVEFLEGELLVKTIETKEELTAKKSWLHNEELA